MSGRVKRMKGRHFGVVLFFCLVPPVLPQTNTPLRDCGAGFRKFYQLGLPDVTGGVYGKLSYGSPGYGRGHTYDGDFSEFQSFGLSGNAWKVKDLGGGTNRYIDLSLGVIDAIDQDTYEAWKKRTEAELAGESARRRAQIRDERQPKIPVVRWKTADIAKDAAKILTKLDKSNENIRELFESHSGTAGHLMLTAAQFYRLGFTNEANRIANRLFALCPDGKQLVQGAIDSIASKEYDKAYFAFSDNADWAAWSQSLTEMLARFPTGWSKAPGVRKLAGLVRARAEHPDPPALSGEGLTDEDQTLARRLASEVATNGGAGANFEQHCWILLRHEAICRADPGTNDVTTAVAVRGMRAVPMLIALLRDNTLVHPGRSSVSSYSGSLGGEDDSEENVFNTLRRPGTRGEVARSLLQPILLLERNQRNEIHRMKIDDFVIECQVWYKEHKGSATEELAKIYLERGDDSQRYYALSWLMHGEGLETNRVEVERILLRMAGEAGEQPNILQRYVQLRREKASNFVEQVAAAILGTNAPAKPVELKGGRVARREQLMRMAQDRGAQFVERLRGTINVKSVKTLVDEYLAGTQSVANVYQCIRGQIAEEDPHKTLDTIMAAVERTQDPRRKVSLLKLTGYLRRTHPEGWEGDPELIDPATGIARPNTFDPAKHVVQWRTLLDDKRGGVKSVREAAAWAIQSLYGEDDETGQSEAGNACCCECYVDVNEARMDSSDIVMFFGERGIAMLVDRANALLAGKPVPKWPSADHVDEQKRVALLKKMASATDAAVEFGKLTPDEQLALEQIGVTNRVLSAKLRPMADRITEVKVEGEFKSASGIEAKFKGRDFGVETVRGLLDVAAEAAKEGLDFGLKIARIPNLGGMRVELVRATANMREAAEYNLRSIEIGTNRQDFAGVAGEVMGGTRSASAWWSLAEAKAGQVPGKAPRKEPESQGSALRGNADIETDMMDAMESDMRAIAETQKRNAQDRFWEELDLIIKKVGAYAPLGVQFSGYGRPVAVETK